MKSTTIAILVSWLMAVTITGIVPLSAADKVLEPGPAQLPAWLKPGKVRFARLDGGPIEARKSSRSSWGRRFTPGEQEVLANLYGTYGTYMTDLLVKAHINFVWVTYSVGFSWNDEAAQRARARDIARKLHAHGTKVAAYMDAVRRVRKLT